VAPRTGRYTNQQITAPIPYNPALLNKNKPKKKIVKKPNTDWYAKALVYKEMLDKGIANSKANLARKEGVTRARVTQILNLTKLAPEIQNYLMTIEDRKDLKILTERRLRKIANIKNHQLQIRRFRELLKQMDKP
jgi:uncharacterized protein YjiS (DUF1127 family)